MPVKTQIWDRYLHGDLDQAAFHDRDHQKKFAAESPTPMYAMAAPNVMAREPAKDVFLGRYMVMGMRTLYGQNYKYLPQYQESGTCFLAGTLVLMADGTEKPIDQVVPGDFVRSHDGSIQQVIDVGSRQFTGNLHSLRMSGASRPLVTTAEHPVLGYLRHRTSNASHRARDWHPASSLGAGDRVFVPSGFDGGRSIFDASVLAMEKVVRVYKEETVTEDRVRPKQSSKSCKRFIPLNADVGFLVGLYAAEGSVEKGARTTFTMHRDEVEVLNRCSVFLKDLFGTSGTVGVSKNLSRLRVSSVALARLLSMFVPGKAITKSFSVDVFTACREFREGVLRGWFEGDGHLSKRRRIGVGVTSSLQLAMDIERLSLSIGARCSVFPREQQDHQNAAANDIAYSGSSLGLVSGVATEKSTRPKNHVEVEGGFAVNIASNTAIWVENVQVWNLEVENTHSYIVADVAVHNCVGQSHSSGATCVMAVSSLLSGLKFPGRAAVAPIYGGSRVEVGKQVGRWDGSTGSWAADWLSVKGGVVTLLEMGLDDNPKTEKEWLATMQRDERSAVAWAASRDGVPANYEQMSKLKPIRSAPLVSTVEEVRASIGNLTPVNICGQVHPSQSLTDKGVSKSISRGGGHSTLLIGQYFDGTNWWYDHLQSWWWYYQGGFCRPINAIDKQFARCVTRIPESWLKSWLVERDCYALVGVQGLEPVEKSFMKIMHS
jgi:hypothetical protein